MKHSNVAGIRSSIEAAQSRLEKSCHRSRLPLLFLLKVYFGISSKVALSGRQGNVEILRKTFYELNEFVEFYAAVLKGHPRINTGAGDNAVVTFTAPYGYANTFVTKENMKQFKSFFLENN